MKIERLINKLGNILNEDNLDKGLSNKYNKKSLENGIMSILLTLKFNKPMIVYGDYDTDGIVSSLLMYGYLKKIADKLGKEINIDIMFSDRKTFFGMGNELYNRLSKKYGLIIMTDNGSEENFLNEKIDNLLVLDHHPTKNNYPFIINPNINTNKYSTSGGKVVFDFLNILDKNLKNHFNVSLFEDKDFYNIFKELTAITLISDMANLHTENRKFIKEALKTMKEKKLPVFSFLKEFTSSEIAFSIVPKINAVSRLEEDLDIVKKWLFPKNLDEFLFADKKIKEIDRIKKEMVLDIFLKITKQDFNKNIVFIDNNIVYLKNENMLTGLNGLIANKFLNEFNKPSIVVSKEKDYFVGSARGKNIKEFFDFLKEKNPSFFKNGNYGGHLDAMGFITKNEEDLELIKNNLHLYKYKNVFNLLDDVSLNFKEYGILKKFYQDIAKDVDFDKKINVLVENNFYELDEKTYSNYTLFTKENIKFLIPNSKIDLFKNANYFLIELSVNSVENVKAFLNDKNDISYKIIEEENKKVDIENQNTQEINIKIF